MAEDVRFRQATREDLRAIIDLLADDTLGQSREARVGASARYETAFEMIVSDPDNQIIVADLGGEIVGCLQLTYIPGLTYTGGTRGQIEGVRIADSMRGRGLGRQLIGHALQLAREKGCVLAQLTSDKRRPEALAFYESIGFRASHEGFKLWF